jgi:hypothetical protein
LAAAFAVLISLVYFLIGFKAVTVLDNVDDQTAFGLMAGGAFLVGAMLIFLTDNRVLWGIGAVAQALIIATYFNLAPERIPSYEPWGISIRVLQVLLLGALVYLAMRRKGSVVSRPARPFESLRAGPN